MKRLTEEFFDNLWFGIRTLWKTKAFTTIAVVCLALGIGGTTAIFSVVKTLLWDPLPYPEPERVVKIDLVRSGAQSESWSMPVLDLLAEHQSTFEDLGGFRLMRFNASTSGEAFEIPGAQVTPGFLAALECTPLAGRLLRPPDDTPSADPVAMVSEALAGRLFASPVAALGESLWLDGRGYTVVGVLPPGFGDVWSQSDVLIPPAAFRDEFPLSHFGANRFTVVGRIAPGQTLQSAQAQLAGLPERMATQWPQLGEFDFSVVLAPLQEELVDPSTTTTLWLLMAAVGSVLLIACANVANLLLTRASVRGRETAIRQALGASASSMLRQHLTEGLVLGVLGGGTGLLVASWGVHLLAQHATDLVPMVGRVRLDTTVLSFTALISVLGAIGFSLVPALASLRAELAGPLKTGGGRAVQGSRAAQRWIVGGEVALALVLLIGAGLSLRTVRALGAVDLGFDAQDSVAVSIDLPPSRYATVAAFEALRAPLLAWISAQPGVTAVGTADKIAFVSGLNTEPLTRDLSSTPLTELSTVSTAIFVVGPGLHQAMGLRLVAGRWFEADDYETSAVVMLDDNAAQRLFPGGAAVGQLLRDSAGVRTVVGVVAALRTTQIAGDNHPVLLRPRHAPWNRTGAAIVVRTRGNVNALAEALRSKALELDPALPTFSVQPYEAAVGERSARRQLLFELLALFASIAAAMAAVGIYGVTSYTVAQRTHEIGVRMVLGASPRRLRSMVVRQSLRPVLAGIAAGLVGAAFATRWLDSMLYGVPSLDPASFAAAVVGIFAVAGLASYVPVRRALRVPPMSALRRE